MKKLLEVIKHPLDPERFHQLLTKKQWVLLFNVVAVAALIISGRLRFSVASIVLTVIALAVVNAVAWLSSKNYPDWK